MDCHPDLAPVAFLLGTWRGAGVGSYPTIETFEYTEEVTFSHVGKPFLAYSQKTKHKVTGQPLHAETGYWRPVGTDGLEVVLSHPTGVVEMLVGTHHDGVIDLHTTTVGLTPTAKSVTELHRRFELSGDRLHYDLAMAAVGLPLTHHLTADLQRVEPAST